MRIAFERKVRRLERSVGKGDHGLRGQGGYLIPSALDRPPCQAATAQSSPIAPDVTP